MVKSYSFHGDEFDYCRTCKKELAEMPKKSFIQATTEAMDAAMDRATNIAMYGVYTTRNMPDLCKRTIHNPNQPDLRLPIAFNLPVGLTPSFSSIKPAILNWRIDKSRTTKDWREWLPLGMPSSTPFHGIDRTVDVTRLSGVRYDFDAALSGSENIHDAMTLAAMEGFSPTHCLLPAFMYLSLVKEMKFIGISGIPDNFTFRTSFGPLEVYPDLDCGMYSGYLISKDSWMYDNVWGYICPSPGYNVILRF